MDQHTYNRAIVRERTDRYHAWLRFMGWPLVYPTLPLGLAAGPGLVASAWGFWPGLGALAGLWGLALYAATRSTRPEDLARDICVRPAWAAFCAMVQQRKDFRRGHLHTRSMSMLSDAWVELVDRENKAFQATRGPALRAGCLTPQEWIALRSVEYFVVQGGMTVVWEE